MDWKQTLKFFPGGIQTESKRPERHVPGVYPKYIDSAKGAYVTCDNGKEYLDYSCALGGIVLGYGFEPVTQAVIKVVQAGNLFNLPHKSETQLAEIIVDMIPSAEKMRFLKTGSEACSAAVRIARAYTGREKIISMGYHGWHDTFQYTADDRKAGIPKQNNIRADHGIELKGLFKKYEKKIAAVIMEPYIYKELSQQYLRSLQHMCKTAGTVLIFDECITGFRTKKHSAQAYYRITPDLTVLSKAMANGFPMSCVCGKADLLDVLKNDVFVSGTFSADLVGIAASIATLTFLRENPVAEHIWTVGGKLQGSFAAMINQPGLIDRIKVDGLPCRPRFVFVESKALKCLFWQECLKRGLMLDDAQFVSWAHKTPELDKTLEAMRGAMGIVRKYIEDPESVLEGEVCSGDFK